jgi:hypothetical protein
MTFKKSKSPGLLGITNLEIKGVLGNQIIMLALSILLSRFTGLVMQITTAFINKIDREEAFQINYLVSQLY